MFTFVQAWLMNKLNGHDRGQSTVEYVILILGVVLFLLVAAFALDGLMNSPVSKASSWISGQNPP